jgi:hypothetical protein
MTYAELAQRILDTHHALLHRELPRLMPFLGESEMHVSVREPWNELVEDHELFPAALAEWSATR